MINKYKFKKKLSISQGRHLRIIKNKIQLFPAKNWKKELKLFKLTKLNYIEWVVSADNIEKNPIYQIDGHQIIKKFLKINKIKCRSVDLDFIVKENPLNLINNKLELFLKKIEIIAENSYKIGVKYLIFPFLENSSPNTNSKISKLINIFNKLHKKISGKILLLIETDIAPKKLLKIMNKLNRKVFINYDLGNSASKNFDFKKEKKYFKFVKNIHLKDRVKNGKTIRFGKGNANFEEFFKFLSKCKFNFDFNLQPARSKDNKDIKEIILNIEYINQLLSKL